MRGVEVFTHTAHRVDGAGNHGEEAFVGVQVLVAVPFEAGDAQVEGDEQHQR